MAEICVKRRFARQLGHGRHLITHRVAGEQKPPSNGFLDQRQSLLRAVRFSLSGLSAALEGRNPILQDLNTFLSILQSL